MNKPWRVVLLGGAVAAALSTPVVALSAPYQSPTTSFGPITGSGNCSTSGTLEQPARDAADAQLADFLTTAARDAHVTALFPDADIGSLGIAPYAVPMPGTELTVSVALNNVTAADAGGATSTTAMSWGSPATGSAPDLLFGSTQQLQDCAPKPTRLVSTAEGGPLASPTAYWNVTGFGSAVDQTTLDSALFTFSEPVDNFGAWFGDLETRSDDVGGGDGGELGYLKLYDAAGAVLSVEPILPNAQTPIVPATPFGCGGTSSNDTSACGNHGTRFLGFTWDTPDVAAFQVIVGDDDNCNNVPTGCDGTGERLSFIGPTYAFDNPELTFEKIVVNDNFGTATAADFSFELVTDPNGTPVISTHAAGETVELQIGTEYGVREVAPDGYTNTATTCSTDETSGTGAIDVPVLAESFTPVFGNSQFACTFTNDDDPSSVSLGITTAIINDDGGTALPEDFDIEVTIGGTASTVNSGATIDLTSPAEVTVAATPVDGYTLVSIECSDAADATLGSTFTPDLSMVSVVCVVTNDDIAPTTTTTMVGSTTTTTTTTTAPTSTTVAPTTIAATTVPLPTTTGPGVELPATGRSAGLSMRIALGVLAAGLALVAAARRRTM